MKKVFTFVVCMAAAIISGTLNAQKRMKTTDKEQVAGLYSQLQHRTGSPQRIPRFAD